MEVVGMRMTEAGMTPTQAGLPRLGCFLTFSLVTLLWKRMKSLVGNLRTGLQKFYKSPRKAY